MKFPDRIDGLLRRNPKRYGATEKIAYSVKINNGYLIFKCLVPRSLDKYDKYGKIMKSGCLNERFVVYPKKYRNAVVAHVIDRMFKDEDLEVKKIGHWK